MQIRLVTDISKNELETLKKMIGEAFVTNELFHEFGKIDYATKPHIDILFALIKHIREKAMQSI